MRPNHPTTSRRITWLILTTMIIGAVLFFIGGYRTSSADLRDPIDGSVGFVVYEGPDGALLGPDDRVLPAIPLAVYEVTYVVSSSGWPHQTGYLGAIDIDLLKRYEDRAPPVDHPFVRATAIGKMSHPLWSALPALRQQDAVEIFSASGAIRNGVRSMLGGLCTILGAWVLVVVGWMTRAWFRQHREQIVVRWAGAFLAVLLLGSMLTVMLAWSHVLVGSWVPMPFEAISGWPRAGWIAPSESIWLPTELLVHVPHRLLPIGTAQSVLILGSLAFGALHIRTLVRRASSLTGHGGRAGIVRGMWTFGVLFMLALVANAPIAWWIQTSTTRWYLPTTAFAENPMVPQAVLLNPVGFEYRADWTAMHDGHHDYGKHIGWPVRSMSVRIGQKTVPDVDAAWVAGAMARAPMEPPSDRGLIDGIRLPSGIELAIVPRVLPAMANAMLFASLAFLVVVTVQARAVTQMPGLCTQCGYDLTGSPDRCPECGIEPEPSHAYSHSLPSQQSM